MSVLICFIDIKDTILHIKSLECPHSSLRVVKGNKIDDFKLRVWLFIALRVMNRNVDGGTVQHQPNHLKF